MLDNVPFLAEAESRPGHLRLATVGPYVAAACIAAIGWNLAVRSWLPSTVATVPLVVVLVAGGTPFVVKLLYGAFRLQFGSDLLAGLSIVVSVILREYLAGAVILLMLSGGTALEEFALKRASTVLKALANRMPQVAHRMTSSAPEDIALSAVRVGDLLVVLPHESFPVDGQVVEGKGSADESFLTGEPYRISKIPGSDVLSGALNGETALTVRVGKLPVDSRYARIVRVMEQAEMNRPPMRRIADRLGAWYTLVALAVAIPGWLLSGDPARFLAVVVIATPCPLLLAIPVAIISAVSVAASRGIIIRDPSMLERVSSCRTMIFDKTGTLTYGKPVLTEIVCAPDVDRKQALRWAASVEQYSRHPLASAILDAARTEQVISDSVSEVTEKPGNGLSALVGPDRIQITGRKLILISNPEMAAVLPPVAPGMESILLVNGRYGATFRFRDMPRRESRSFIRHLAPQHGVRRILLLSGDREGEVLHLASQVGIGEALFGKSPEEKVAIVGEEAKLAPTMFLGDGINDAPAMQAATVGIAFGKNSDVTAEAADAVIFETSLRKVDELIHIGRRMKRIALQSAVGGILASFLGMLIAATGHLSPVAGAVTQEVIDVAALLNALRVASSGKELQSDEM